MCLKGTHRVPLFLFLGKNSERMKRMNKKANLWTGVSVLVTAVLAVMAFVRGDWQLWLLIGIFSAWAVWAAVYFLIPYLKLQKYCYVIRKRRKKNQSAAQKKNFDVPDVSDPVDLVLLRHVNYRISGYLQSSYPDATWQWREEAPEKIIAAGGTGRIQLYGVPDFDFADVSFDQKADIQCSLLKVVPLAQTPQSSGEKKTIPQNQPSIDPQVWYEKQGRNVLENLISDLNSRGHHSLTIRDNGEIAINQADTEITRKAFESVPERTYWPRLAKVFEREGMAANITDSGLILSW